MKYVNLTVKVRPDVAADIEAFARQMFPIPCPKCKGSGVVRTGQCPNCDGAGAVGQKSDAMRYLFQFALGQQATPEARAMAAIYANTAPKLIAGLSAATHRVERELYGLIHEVIEQSLDDGPIPDTP